MIKLSDLIKVITCALLFATLAIEGKAQEYKNEFGFKSDNDAYLWYGQDRYYTNGLFINFRRAVNQKKLGNKLEKLVYELSAAQKMYNPFSGYSPQKEQQDRPFAAYLYGAVNVNLLYKNESALKTGLEIGFLGPDALGEEAQKLLHKIVGFYEVQGWQYQIKNTMAVNLTAQYTDLIYRSEDQKTDFSFEGYGNLGTTFSGVGAGILFRAGSINQLFNSAYTNAALSHNGKTSKLVRNEFFFYAKPQLNYIAYDATVEGSMFNHNSPVTFGVKPWVFAQQVGFNYSTPRFTLDYHLIFKSREVKSTAKPHQYGSISMYYRFN